MDNIKDLRVTLRLYNNQLRERREALQFSQSKLAEKIGINVNTYMAYELLQRQPVNRYGEVKPGAVKIAEYFNVPLSTLWPEMISLILTNRAERKIDISELVFLTSNQTFRMSEPPDHEISRKELRRAVKCAVLSLPENDRKVVSELFGLNGEDFTIEEISSKSKLSKSEVKASSLRGIQHCRNLCKELSLVEHFKP